MTNNRPKIRTSCITAMRVDTTSSFALHQAYGSTPVIEEHGETIKATDALI